MSIVRFIQWTKIWAMANIWWLWANFKIFASQNFVYLALWWPPHCLTMGTISPNKFFWFLMLKWYFLYWICISRGLNYVFNDEIQNSSKNWGFCGEGGWKMSKIFGFQKMWITRWDLSLSFSKGYIRYSNFSSSFRICSKKLEKPLFKHKKWPFLGHFWTIFGYCLRFSGQHASARPKYHHFICSLWGPFQYQTFRLWQTYGQCVIFLRYSHFKMAIKRAKNGHFWATFGRLYALARPNSSCFKWP